MIDNQIIKTRILIIGSNGMLGQRLGSYLNKFNRYEILCTSFEPESFLPQISYSEIDITKKNSVREKVLNFFPDFIINTAAFTNVDKCESERETAWKVNVLGVERKY